MYRKRNFSKVSSIIFAALFTIGSLMQVQAGNILTNGGFESGNNGWTISNPGGQPYTFNAVKDSTKARSGNYAGCVSRYTGKQILIFQNAGSVSGIAAGGFLMARVYIKTENLHLQDPSAGVNVVLVGLGSNGNIITSFGGEVNFNGTDAYSPVDIISPLSSGVVNAQIQVQINSPISSGAFYIDDASIESLDGLGQTTSNIPDCKLVKDSKGTPRLTINGVAKAPVFFMGNNQTGQSVIYPEMTKAAAADVNFIQICMNLPWSGLNNGVIERAIKANPKAMFFPRVFNDAPQAWIAAHPDQIMKTESGKVSWNVPSYASDLYFDECKKQFGIFIRYIHNSPYKDRFIGYHLSGSENFYGDCDAHYYDYSEVNRKKFSQWAEKKYANISALNTAWKKNYTNFDGIQIPRPAELEVGDDGFFRNPSLRRYVADYNYYLNDLTAQRQIELAEYVKSITHNKSLVGVFYGYQLELIQNCMRKGLANGGHMGLRQVLANPSVDLLCGPCSYYDRKPGRPNGMMSIVDSITEAGKIWLEEDDSRTYFWTNAESWWYIPTEWDTLQCLRRNFGNVIGHNQAIWWMDLAGSGNYNAKSIWDSNKIAVDTYKDSIANEQPTTPQVALIYDQEFYTALKADSLALTSPNGYLSRTIFQTLGAQVGYYYIQDIPKIPSSVKLYVFVDAFIIDAGKKALIDKIKTNNNTLLWLYAPGYVTENDLSISNMKEVTGFDLAKQSDPVIPGITVASIDNPICQRVAGHSFGLTSNTIAPSFYGTGSDGSIVLGNYKGTSRPGLILKKFDTWSSIFCGSPILSVPIMRSVCLYAGAPLLVDPDNMFTEDAVTYNGRYLYIYARTHAGTRTLHVPGGPVDVEDMLTGKSVAKNVTNWSVDFKENEQKIFKVVPAARASGSQR